MANNVIVPYDGHPLPDGRVEVHGDSPDEWIAGFAVDLSEME